jgi:exodeoxyribonuclease-3
LQEIKAGPEQIPELLLSVGGYWCYWHGQSGYSGVALLVNQTLCVERPVFTHPAFDHEQRIVAAEVGGLTIASVYVPNGGKDFEAKLRFLASLAAWTAEVHGRGGALVICGDLNVAREARDVHPKERKPNQIGTRPEERALLERVLEAGLLDVGRALDPDNEFLFTWWAPWRNLRQRNIGWRIDYVLASRRLAAGAERAASLRDFGTSDHAPVVVSFGTPFRDAGVGLQPGAQPAGHEAPRLRPSASGAPGGWTGSQADRETRLKPATTG